MKTKFYSFLALIVTILVVSASSHISNFSNLAVPGNISMIEDTNYTYYLNISLGSNVTSALINITGSNTSNSLSEGSVYGAASGTPKGGAVIGDYYYYCSGTDTIYYGNSTNTSIGSITSSLGCECSGLASNSTTTGQGVLITYCAKSGNHTMSYVDLSGNILEEYNYSTLFDGDIAYHEGIVYAPNDDLLKKINFSTGAIISDFINISAACYGGSYDYCSSGVGLEVLDDTVFVTGRYPKSELIFKYDFDGNIIQTTDWDTYNDDNYGLAYSPSDERLLVLGYSMTFSFCFDENTEILTSEGNVKISDISVNDKVYSLNEDVGLLELDEVTAIRKRDISESENRLYQICTIDECVNSTLNHIFFTLEGLKQAKDLDVLDVLFDKDLSHQNIIDITVYHNLKDIFVWDIDIKNNKAYFANNILVDENGKRYEELNLANQPLP